VRSVACAYDSTPVVRDNSDSIVEAVWAVYIEEGNDTPLGAAEWLYRHSRTYEATKSLADGAQIVKEK
jgi:hypothetical protein